MFPRTFAKAREITGDKGFTILMIILLAVLAGYQIYNPSKRVIEAATGIVFISLIAKYPLTWALSFFIVMYPLPFSLQVGTSNVVFLPLMIIIWLIRVSVKNVERPTGSILDGTIILMTISYIVSFYNSPGGYVMKFAMVFCAIYLTAVGFFYLIVNFAKDSKSLERVVLAGVVSCFVVVIYSILEMLFPGRALIPGWLYTAHKRSLIMQNIRVEGPFFDFELLGEFFALNIPIVILFYIRSKRMLFRFAYFGLIMLCIGILMATSTRGAFISLFIGSFYMLYMVRKDLNVVRISFVVIITVALVALSEYFVSKYTISGGMMQRMIGTKFIGIIPDTRKAVWTLAWERSKEHIIIGHSPAWDFSKRIGRYFWPHNGYLFYLNITGLFGLSTFLLLLYKLLKSSLKLKAKSLFDPSFPKALMLVLHIDLVIFIIDEIKIDYMRNQTYLYFVWYLFGLIAATHNVIRKESEKAASAEAST